MGVHPFHPVLPVIFRILMRLHIFRQILLLGLACSWGVLPVCASAEERAFWVWHRRDALSEAERTAITASRAVLFWHVGELVVSGTAASWRWRDAAPPESTAVPVVRLELAGKAPLDQPGLVELLVPLADAAGRLQVDCDCPDRLLAEYAAFLKRLRAKVPHLSATALAGWAARPEFAALAKSVERLAVMFYDLRPDPPRLQTGRSITKLADGSVPGAMPLPILERESFRRELASWNACRTPWLAGLPNFFRITVYDAAGRCLGHIRNWNWDEVIFQRALRYEAILAPGLLMLSATADCVIAETPVRAGQWLAVRWPDRVELTGALDAVARSNATGVAWFRFPDSSDASGWSVAQLGNLAGKPTLRLSVEPGGTASSGRLVLKNAGGGDLAPRLEGNDSGQRGYALEVDAPAQVWREAVPGDFWRVGAHADPDGKLIRVPVPFATRLTFWFSPLRAGESLRTGLIQLAPDAAFGQIRYRILPEQPVWKTLP